MAKVIFDTNGYRNLVSTKTFEEIDDCIALIKVKEKENDIETMFSPIVAQELLAHLADKNDNAFDRCLRANKAMYLHNGDRAQVNMFPMFEALLAHMYFNDTPAKRIETYNAIAQISMHLALNPNEATFAIFHDKLQTIKASVDMGEAGFVDGMFQFVKQTDPAATDWMPFRNDPKKRQKLLTGLRSDGASYEIAKGYIFMTHINLIENGHSNIYSAEQITDFSKSVLEKFPEPIALFKTVIENLVNSDFPLDQASRANFVWDIALMFGAGKHSIGNDKLYFVTGDKAIINTAIRQGSGTSVLTLQEYLDYIGV
ncbi:hypothetical protein DIU31_023995 [Mucilaginibacter rubeus]|uniref:Uncharacterized protein n=1 Tax=Mucilaginibacter rubeus TaxID=2027860 RepID=A0AAE6MK61_9SPHI|nr:MULTISPECIES: hypothetical protein [Mucilaginibacter]QEM06425.1 hypothetical protein DIU31_023995 [Mucilaginibacter rubeus]QEM19009.1 hypothetical protein DIU38_024225 [Mucilaginibacter gossypii]QTE44450.1 hypothetical protein J3L19_03480 [Mucilaginibacter rubeus]QTE51049.1 hypothetical protein J3L21_03455 [Mucilaginibacter rubeus]QTE56132.1 hypothetical protein J3L23_28695 [Mucilaginibacter rubeus]